MLFFRLLQIDFTLHSDTLKAKAIPALIGAGISLLFIKSGVLFLFFLVPLGVLAFRYGYAVAWTGFLITVLGNLFLLAVTTASRDIPLTGALWDFLYFVIMTSIFVWICAPLPVLSHGLSGGIRLITGSCLGAILVTIIILRAMAAPVFLAYLDSWIKMFASVNHSDVVNTALLDSLSAERVLEIVKAILLRGGSLVSCIFMFFVCRQISATVSRFNTKLSSPENVSRESLLLVNVRVFPQIIWVFSFSLFLVVLTRIFKLEIPEIILWNVLILCVMLYLAQGLGVFQFILMKPTVPPLMRILLGVLFFVFLFSPVINAVLIGGMVLLGIAENWVPFRAPKNNGPPSTPEAGDDN